MSASRRRWTALPYAAGFAALSAAALLGCPDAVRAVSPGPDATVDAASEDPRDDASPAPAPKGADGVDAAADAPVFVDAADSGDAGDIELVVYNSIAPTKLAVDDANVYFAEWPDGGPSTGVLQCPKDGCRGEPMRLTDDPVWDSLFVAQGYVYWGNGGSLVGTAVGRAEGKRMIDAGVEGPSLVEATYLVWSQSFAGRIESCRPAAPGSGCDHWDVLAPAPDPVSMASEDGVVYWIPSVTNGGDGLMACAVTGCNQTPRRVSSGKGESLVVSNKVAYWVQLPETEAGTPRIVSCPVSGCAMPTVLASPSSPVGLAVDEKHLYWLDPQGGSLYRCPLSGCGDAPEVFVSGQNFPWEGNVALDERFVYWPAAGVLRKRK